MCVCAFEGVELSKTIILLGETPKGKRYIHYKNAVQLQAKPRRRESAQAGSLPADWQFDVPSNQPEYVNIMFWPVLAKYDTIGVRDAKSAPFALDDVATALKPVSRGVERGGAKALGIDDFFVVETEFYTTIVAASPAAVFSALSAKNIKLPAFEGTNFPDMVKTFERGYPGMPVALNLMKATDKGQVSAGILLTYEPAPGFEDIFFAPCLDGHGKLDLKQNVITDHTIAIACASNHGVPIRYRGDNLIDASVRECLPDRVLGATFESYIPNGDFIFSRKAIQRGEFLGRRILPWGLEAAERTPSANYVLGLEGVKRVESF